MSEIKLTSKISFNLIPKRPFSFDGTFHKPSHFPNNLKTDDWRPSVYWQTLRLKREIFGIQIDNAGSLNKPCLKVKVFSRKKLPNETIESIKEELVYRFELNIDLTEFNALGKKDKRFNPIFKKWNGMRNSSQNSLYELLIIAIVLQNATVRRSAQMLDALLRKYGTKVRFDGLNLYSIWLPEKLESVSEQELRDLKIGYRAKFIKRLSSDFARKLVDEKKLRILSKEDTKEELMKLYGIGPETARILLFEALHHYDTFDHIAPWQQKIYSMLFYHKKSVPVSRINKDITKQYGKYAMLAVHYIWEDIFWKRKNEHIPWLEKEIRL